MKLSPLIVALDVDNEQGCWDLVEKLDSRYCAVKIGSELFTQCGPDVVRQCIKRGFRVFLDLKFHDIPTTVARAVKAAAELGVWMVNVHASGGKAMLIAAREALEAFGPQRPLLIGVTVLTSHDEQTLHETGVVKSPAEQVECLASLVNEANLDGVVCSGLEVARLKALFGPSFLTVTPGLRWQDGKQDDQVRTLSPMEAKQQGADYLVIGRLLTRHPDPRQLLEEIYKQVGWTKEPSVKPYR
ncbi:MAG: orotidine-5'-phosphate decarboxylase [Gammaproteobacteria bacterium]|nr:orotidine-5'-phosphate decarboxylase [Gammaproteobacteria bacterium]